MPTEVYDQLKELFQRATVLEQDIKRHEQIAIVVFSILTALGIFSLSKLRKWIRKYIAEKTAEALKDIEAAKNARLKQIDDLNSQASGLVLLLQETARRGPGLSRFDIQMGEREVTFHTSYLRHDEIFPRKFASVPNIYVGEARAGSWVIVKVDAKSAAQFTWAANNLVASFPHTTLIQWIAIADIGGAEGAPPPESSKPAVDPASSTGGQASAG